MEMISLSSTSTQLFAQCWVPQEDRTSSAMMCGGAHAVLVSMGGCSCCLKDVDGAHGSLSYSNRVWPLLHSDYSFIGQATPMS